MHTFKWTLRDRRESLKMEIFLLLKDYLDPDAPLEVS